MMPQCRTPIPLLLVPFIACVLFSAQAAKSAPAEPAASKAYSPFDEPRPKIPQEIIDDKRLDMKVKVFVKSKNMKQLFTDLRAKTGVKITAARELHGERPIIYFHKRPLRDVMTEVSGLYGYYWLISGKPGAYEYELFEDIRHAERRDQAVNALKRKQDASLLDLTRKCMADGKLLDKLVTSGQTGTDPAMMKAYVTLLSRFGTEFLSKVLADESATYRVGDLSADLQSAVADWRNPANARMAEAFRTMGRNQPDPPALTPADIQTASIMFKRITQGLYGMPSIQLQLHTAQQGNALIAAWPPFRIDAKELSKALDEPESEPVIADKPLPEEPKITADKLRWLPYRRGLVMGDVLNAIADRADLDIIADNHFADQSMQAVADEPLDRLVIKVCKTFGYTCQVQRGTARFRLTAWYTESIPVEPPADLLASWWTTIEQKGRLDIHDVLAMASLPDQQLKWPGFRLMPGAAAARNRPSTLRLWASLIGSQEAQARTDEGLKVSDLDDDQTSRLAGWMDAMKIQPTQQEMTDAVIRIRGFGGSSSESAADVDRMTTHEFSLKLPDGKSYPISLRFPPPLLDKDRKDLIAQRKADAEADVIEVLK